MSREFLSVSEVEPIESCRLSPGMYRHSKVEPIESCRLSPGMYRHSEVEPIESCRLSPGMYRHFGPRTLRHYFTKNRFASEN